MDIIGTDGPDTLNGTNGDDSIDGRGGADMMIGGTGNDWYYVDNAGDVVVEGPGEGGFDRIFASISYVLQAGVHVEALTTTNPSGTAAINLTGNELDNFIGGNAGANILTGGGGADTLVGLGGNDIYYVDSADDRVIEGSSEPGFDRIYASTSYTLEAGAYIEALTTTDVAGTAAINLTGNERDNFIGGNEGANVLHGGAGFDTMRGLGGDDRLDGGSGVDWLYGGLGDDWYYVDNSLDVVYEFENEGAFDRVFTSVNFSIRGAVGVEALTTTDQAATTALQLTGNDLNNFIAGNAGDNIIDGRSGADRMVGLGGSDSYYVDNAGDIVVEGANDGAFDRIYTSISYTLEAGAGIEALTAHGVNGSINLTGNGFGNFIAGSYDANVLDGGGGADTLVGLGGQDAFAFTTALGGGNVDAINDFVVADDTIWLDDAVFTGLSAGALPAGAFAIGSAATEADDRIIYNSSTGALLFDADGVGGAAAVQFASLGTGLAMTSADFLVI
jgi:serralysin